MVSTAKAVVKLEKVLLAQSVKIIEGGKFVIPAQMRRAMGIGRGDTVVVELLPEGELRVRSLAAAIKKAQAIVGQSISRNRSLANELMRERKEEADRELRATSSTRPRSYVFCRLSQARIESLRPCPTRGLELLTSRKSSRSSLRQALRKRLLTP